MSYPSQSVYLDLTPRGGDREDIRRTNLGTFKTFEEALLVFNQMVAFLSLATKKDDPKGKTAIFIFGLFKEGGTQGMMLRYWDSDTR